MSKIRKKYHPISHVCEELDLPASTIRYWESRFSILKPRKNAKGTRFYTAEDLSNFRMIYHLVKEKKMTLEGAETFIMQNRMAAKSELGVVEILQRIRSTFEEILQEIETAEAANRRTAKGSTEQVSVVSTPTEHYLDDEKTDDQTGEKTDEKTKTTAENTAENLGENPGEDNPDYPFTQLELF